MEMTLAILHLTYPTGLRPADGLCHEHAVSLAARKPRRAMERGTVLDR
jgi:hypothetical protein